MGVLPAYLVSSEAKEGVRSPCTVPLDGSEPHGVLQVKSRFFGRAADAVNTELLLQPHRHTFSLSFNLYLDLLL